MPAHFWQKMPRRLAWHGRAASLPPRHPELLLSHMARPSELQLELASGQRRTSTDVAEGRQYPGTSGKVVRRWPSRGGCEQFVPMGQMRHACAPPLVPFAIGYNKVLMCRPDAHDALLTHVKTSRETRASVRKTAEFLGGEVVVLPHGWISTFHGNERLSSSN